MNSKPEKLTGLLFFAAVVLLVSFGFVIAQNHARASESSVALPDPSLDEPLAPKSGKQTAVVAGGCFWGIQLVFQHVKGVKSATSGYSGGTATSPEY